MLGRLAPCRRLGGVQKSACVGRRPEQVCRLLPGGVLVGRHQHGVPALGRDLDGCPVVVDLLDEREQRSTGFACSDRHAVVLLRFIWYQISYHFREPSASSPRWTPASYHLDMARTRDAALGPASLKSRSMSEALWAKTRSVDRSPGTAWARRLRQPTGSAQGPTPPGR